MKLRMYFAEELHKIYRDGSTLNANYKKIDAYEQKETEFKVKESTGNFIDQKHREREYQVVLRAKDEAESAKEKIERLKEKASESDILPKVIKRIEDERPKPVLPCRLKYPSTLCRPKIQIMKMAEGMEKVTEQTEQADVLTSSRNITKMNVSSYQESGAL